MSLHFRIQTRVLYHGAITIKEAAHLMERKPQNFANHTKFDPPFHFVMMPLLLITFITAIVNVVRHYDSLGPWILLMLSILAILTGFKARVYALKVQDRLIRLEERLRLQSILPDPLRGRLGELNEGQLVGIRFASDAECPAIVQRALADNLKAKEIKQMVQNWRPDYFRV